MGTTLVDLIEHRIGGEVTCMNVDYSQSAIRTAREASRDDARQHHCVWDAAARSPAPALGMPSARRARREHPAAMKSSLGLSSTDDEAALLSSLLQRLSGRVVLFVGDSTLRNQFVQLARVGLKIPRTLPLAMAVTQHNFSGAFSSSSPIKQPDRPDSSNGYWGGFGWMAATTPANATFAYAKIWGCTELKSTLQMARKAMNRHQRRTGYGRWPPDALMWNFGLHLLHMYPARPVPTVSLRCALGYEALVHTSLRELRRAAPTATLLWRTTNAVCDGGFVGDWADVIHAYRCDADGSCELPPARRIRERCEKRYNVSQVVCNHTVMSRQNTLAQQRLALKALRVHCRPGGSTCSSDPQLRVVDAFSLTDGQCAATADGRHYPNLLARINSRLLETLTPLLAGPGV